MNLERWMCWDKDGRTRTLLVPAGKQDVTVDGLTFSVFDDERLKSSALAFSLAIARTSANPHRRRFERVALSFSPNVAEGKQLAGDGEEGTLLLHYSELFSTWASLVEGVGLTVETMEEVEFGRIAITLSAANASVQSDHATALALLAVALDELALQRGLVAKGTRIDAVTPPSFAAVGQWGVHLAKAPVAEQ